MSACVCVREGTRACARLRRWVPIAIERFSYHFFVLYRLLLEGPVEPFLPENRVLDIVLEPEFTIGEEEIRGDIEEEKEREK